MTPDLSSSPAFGYADLSNCEREQIQLAASIQPHGALIVLSEPDLVVIQVSENAGSLLRIDRDLIGARLDELVPVLAARVRPRLGDNLAQIPLVLRTPVGVRPERDFDAIVHRPPAGGLVVELEPSGAAVDLSARINAALQTIIASASLRSLCDEAARIFKSIAGYDRVMVYRFDDEGHGEVLSEQREPELEAYLGNRYPDSDIPRIARRLYERNRIRLLVDVDYEPVRIHPRTSPVTGEDLDMSLCSLRSMSPIHIQYLKNMGVGATLVASLLVGGRLWGLIACHHRGPRFVQYEIRAVCELLAEAVATRIAALESFVQAQAELSVRRLEQRMVEAISREGDWTSALFDDPRTLLQTVDAAGAALICDGRILTTGEVPGTRDLREIGAWLDTQPRSAVMATASLRRDEPRLADLTPVASGILAAPVSSCMGEYLIWCRPERVRTVTWGGNPFKPVFSGNDPAQLSPRRSFAQWHQVVEGTSDPWTSANLATARLIGESVADVIQQFRSVRVLIAQAQLAQVRSQVRVSEQPILIADADGVFLLTTQSFERLLHPDQPPPQCLDDLLALFSEPAEARRRLNELVNHRRAWRGEVELNTRDIGLRPFLVRADPVFSSPGSVLGFVILLTDLSERKSAEDARHRVQAGLLEQQKLMRQQLQWSANPMYRELLSAIVGNAQLAALEVTDGVDLGRVPALVDAVQSSVHRTTQLLEHLAWYSAQNTKDDPPIGN
ncbi:GAF domain-containing protein [Thiocapsa bogorovii]|uniref:BphP n=1 Tax=Thiocapsa roseopersicina TaxID=1058 RepID=Q2TJQ7_THIRO|nr:GAF domain-containing protein [Thiocapsa bogorovii]AAX53581.1 BphP [Thiocapsa roseopersicina]UHD18158.1 GAF domain-containing protein [Thiocapsa bogorovii]